MKIKDLFRKKAGASSLPVFDGVSEIRAGEQMKIPRKTALILDILLELLVSVLSGWSFVHVFTSAFGLSVNELLFLPVILAVSFVVLLIARDKKIGVFLFAAMIGTAVVLAIIRLQDLVAECTGIYDRLVQSFDEAYHTSTNIHYTVAPDHDVTFIMMIFAVLPIWQTGYSYGRNIPPFIATAFLLIPPVLAAVCLKPPHLFPASVLVFCILLQFVLCRSECLSEMHEMSRSVQLRIRFFLSAAAVLAVLFLTVFSAFAVFPAIRKPFEKASDVYAKSSISDLLAKIKGNPFDISKPGMSGGDFSNVGSVVRNEKTILRVEFENNSTQPVYLRGFSGDRYTGEAWEVSESGELQSWMPEEIRFTDVYSGRIDAKDENFRNPYLYLPALYAGSFLHSAGDYNVLSIRETDDRDDYVYLPYFVTGGESSGLSNASFVSDLYMELHGREQTYFQTVSYPSLHDAITMSTSRQYLLGLTQPSGTPLSGYEEPAVMTELLNNRYQIPVTLEELMAKPYTEYVFQDSEGKEIHMRLKEACVTSYEGAAVRNHLDSGATARVKDLASELASEFQIDVNAREYEKAVNAVQQYLWQQKEYSLNPGPAEDGADFVEDFLFTKDSGYCVHFASAGTVLLRELGIPCRYCEGYLVSPAMGGEAVEISDKDAHAWTEVFIPGFGWYPVEMTLSTEDPDRMQESSFTLESPETSESEIDASVSEDPSAEIDAESMESGGSGEMPETTENAGNPENPSDNPPDGPGQEPVKEPFKLPDWFFPVLISVLAAAILIAGILYLRYHIVPYEKLQKEDGKTTCRRIYDRIRRQAGKNGLKFTPDSSAERLFELYPEIPKERLSEMQRIIKEACYRKEDVAEEDCRTLYDIYSERLLMRDPFVRKPSPHSDSGDHR